MCTKLTVSIESQNYPPFWHAFRTHAGDCKANNYLRQIPTTGFVRRFQGATFSRENISLKTFTKMFFDLLLWQENHNTITVKKQPLSFSSQPAFLPQSQ